MGLQPLAALRSNVLIVAITEIVEENNYYPFGLKHKGYNGNINSTTLALKRKFVGKELQDDSGAFTVKEGDLGKALGLKIKEVENYRC